MADWIYFDEMMKTPHGYAAKLLAKHKVITKPAGKKPTINAATAPEISIIIPAYNTAKYIAECLDSVLAQTFTNWEAICINDGSTDNSQEILEEYAKQDKRIKVIKQKNQGVCAARNNAIKTARGKYIFPLDSDDIILPKCLETLYKIITTTDNAAVCPLGHSLRGKKYAPWILPEPTIKNMYSLKNGLHNSTMYPKALWEKYGGYDEKFRHLGLEDFDFYLNFIDDNKPVCHVQGDLFIYRIKPAEESRNLSKSSVSEQQKEAIFKKRPIMRLWWDNMILEDRVERLLILDKKANSNKTVKLLGVIPLLKIRHKRGLQIYRLFGVLPLLLVRYKEHKTIWRLFGFLPILSVAYKTKVQTGVKSYAKKILVNLICAFIPIKNVRHHVRAAIESQIVNHIARRNYSREIKQLRQVARRNYSRKIKQLRQAQRIIDVAFLVDENQKWNGDELYKKFAADPKFRPRIFITWDGYNHNGDNLKFFKERGYDVVDLIDRDVYARGIPEEYNIDIVFYQQPWFSLGGPLNPVNMSKRAVCLYFPYAISIGMEVDKIKKSCIVWWLSLYKQFVFNNAIHKEFERGGVRNTLPVGHPKMDAYGAPIKNNPWKSKKIRIIYAPHYSLAETHPLHFATFRWNGKQILDLAKKTAKTTEWIFKPHPRFKVGILEAGIMTKQEIDAYYEAWEKIGQVCNTGDYFDMFRTSDMLITDCGSFLAEYLPTNKPVIHLIPKSDTGHSELSKQTSRHYYKAQDIEQLMKYFDMLTKRKEDPMRELRAKDCADWSFNASDKIYNYVKAFVS